MPKVVSVNNAHDVQQLIKGLPKISRTALKPKFNLDSTKFKRNEDEVLDFHGSVHVRSRLPKGITAEAAQGFLEWQHDNVARPDVDIDEEYIDKAYPTNYEEVGLIHKVFNLGFDPKENRYKKLIQMEEKARLGYMRSNHPSYVELDHHVVVGKWWGWHYFLFGKILFIATVYQTIQMLQYTDLMSRDGFAALMDGSIFSDDPIDFNDIEVPNYAVVKRDDNGRYYIDPEDLEQVRQGKIPEKYTRPFQIDEM